MVSHWTLYFQDDFLILLEQTMRPDEIVCKWHSIYLYQILWGRPETTLLY